MRVGARQRLKARSFSASPGLHPTDVGIPLAKSAQAVARVAKREVRVAARGIDRNQAARRWRSIAAAVATCCRRVLASPRWRLRRSPKARTLVEGETCRLIASASGGPK